MVIKILGSGCANCKRTKVLAQQVVEELHLDAQVQEVTDVADIMRYGIMSTPGIVIDEKVVGYGGVPTRAQMEQILRQAAGL
ncbi:thioredoxin family protein [Candidatus Parcubacteria bacterium]|nr:MAG: thioredoxin family protein [Candidatus Parcubacteria bacterium]